MVLVLPAQLWPGAPRAARPVVADCLSRSGELERDVALLTVVLTCPSRPRHKYINSLTSVLASRVVTNSPAASRSELEGSEQVETSYQGAR